MATSRIQVSEGSGKSVATYSISEDAVTKEVQRVALADETGAAVGVALESGGNLAAAVALLGTIDTDTSGIITSVQLIDDAIVADDAAFTPATTKVMMAGFTFDDSAPDSVNEGDAGAARMSANRNVYVTIRDAAGNERGLNVGASGELTVAAHAVTNAGVFVVQENGAALTALQLIDDAIYVDDADWTDNTSKHMLVGGVYQSAPHTVTDGDVTPFLTDVNGRLAVAVGNTVTVASHAVTNAGTFPVQIDGAALTSLQLLDDVIFAEDSAHTTLDKGIPAFLVRRDTASALGADNDYTPGTTNARAAQWVAIEDGAGGQITSFGGGTEYTSDAASPAAPVGATSLIVRDDALSTQETTDDDWTVMRGNSRGALWVAHDGNITADLGATDNAVLDAIAASVAASDVDLTTIIGHVDGLEGLLTTIDGDTGGILTAVQLLDNSVVVLGTDTYTETTSSGLAMGAVRRDADTTLVGTTNEWGPLQMDANGRLKVEAFSGETLPVSVSGVSTLAEQQTQTTHLATIAGDTTSIQTAVELLDNAVAVLGTATYTEATTSGLVMGAVRRDADTTLVGTTNEIAPLIVDANGYLKVEVFSGGTLPVSVASGGIASGAIASGAIASGAIAAGAIAAGATSIATTEDSASAAADHLVKIAAVRLDTPIANAAVSNDGDYTSPILDNFRKLWVTGTVPEDTAHISAEAITANGVRRIDTPATSAGTSGDWATMDSSAEGAIWATLTPTTTGGLTIFRSIDIDESEEEVKASAGNVYGYYFANTNAAARYLKFYNATAASVSVGTTTPVMTLYMPPSSAGHVAFPYPIGFATAICVAATTGVADADTGAPSANDCLVMVYYK